MSETQLNLFEQCEEWKEPIKDAENHSFFKGNIHFLLPDGEKSDLELFIQRKDIAKKLFNENGDSLDKTNYLLMRSTLSKCDASKISFPITLKDDKENWKKLLDKEFKNDIIRLLDDLVVSANYMHSLEKICKDFNTTCIWQENLVKNSFLLSSGHSINKKVDVYSSDRKRIFLYHKSNWTNDAQILIGDRERNQVILTFISHGFKFVQEWQKFDNSNTFFKGGVKIMLKKDNIILDFHFDKITVQGDNNKEYKFGEIEKLKNDFSNYFLTI